MKKKYQKLETIFERLHRLNHAGSILSWDEATMMPPGSSEARAQARAELKVIHHEILTSPELSDILQDLHSGLSDPQKEPLKLCELTPWEQANIREATLAVHQAQAVDSKLIEAISMASSHCEMAWRTLRAKNNWQDFHPLLDRVIQLAREEGKQRSQQTGIGIYDSLLEIYSPGITSERISELFGALKSSLPNLILKVMERQRQSPPQSWPQPFPIEIQQQLGRQISENLGLNFQQARLDISHHPFCGGTPEDIRITTRYKVTNFVESLLGVIHETGHALYNQGLTRTKVAQPAAWDRGFHVHESQSLFFEIFVGRSRPFLRFILPKLQQAFITPTVKETNSQTSIDGFWSEENLFKHFNRVHPSLIRVDADEVTYPLHVILRFEIEKELMEGNLTTQEIPSIWNEKMTKYLGLSTQGNYKDGCMQDSHWPSGAFGYFPSYSLGVMLAAQLYASLKKESPQVEAQIECGDFTNIHKWLRQKIWSQGSYYKFDDLVINATGEPLSPDYFEKHITEKFL